MDRLRRRPLPISPRMNASLTACPSPAARSPARASARVSPRSVGRDTGGRRRPARPGRWHPSAGATGPPPESWRCRAPWPRRGSRRRSCSSTTRLRISLTMSSSCVAITTVVPFWLILSSTPMMPMEVVGSRFPVGSSASRMPGLFTTARAIATRCCSPPESSCGRRFSLPSRPTVLRTSGTVSRMTLRLLPITCMAKATLAKTVFCGSRRKSWNTTPMPRRSRGTRQLEMLADVLAGDVDRAGGGAVLLQDQAQEGRFAGAGGADEEGEFATVDLKVDRIQRRPRLLVIDLGDIFETDHGPSTLQDRPRGPGSAAGARAFVWGK